MRSIQEILSKSEYKETEIEEFLLECWADYLYFAEHVLGFEIADYHREWLDLAEKFKRIVIIAFRGSGKTYFFAGYYLWKSIFQEKRETLIISKTDMQAKQILKVIRNMLVDNEILKQFVPEAREAIWKATELELANKSIFYCKTYSENVRSWHPDDVMCDEIGEYEDKTIYYTAVLGTVQLKRGNVTCIGTPKTAVDLLAELKNNSEYMCKEYPAEIQGKPIWPQRYSMDEEDSDTRKSLIKTRKEMGELPYTQEYLLIPISSANSLFPYEITTPNLSDIDKFIPFGRKDERYYIGYDIAISVKGDYTVMTVIGVNSNGKRIVYAKRFREDFERQKVALRTLVKDFCPVKILIDATGLGEQQARELSVEFAGVEPMKITYEEKYKMLLDLRQEFERFNLSIPNNKEDIPTYQYSQELIRELNDFGLKIDLRAGQSTKPKFISGKYDDCVMSLALANRASISPFGQISIRGIED